MHKNIKNALTRLTLLLILKDIFKYIKLYTL